MYLVPVEAMGRQGYLAVKAQSATRLETPNCHPWYSVVVEVVVPGGQYHTVGRMEETAEEV